MFIDSVLFCFALLAIFGTVAGDWASLHSSSHWALVGVFVMALEGISSKNLDNWAITIGAVTALALLSSITPHL